MGFLPLGFLILTILGVFTLVNPQLSHSASFDSQTVDLINSQRQKVGLGILSTSANLTQAALNHNNTMITCAAKYGTSTCFKHTVTKVGESVLLDRLKNVGYSPSGWGEIIARGQKTPSAVVTAWMGSSGHKGIILGNYKEIGCSFVNYWWTCDFGRGSSSSVPVTSPKPSPVVISNPTPTPKVSPSPSPRVSPSISPSVKPSENPAASEFNIPSPPSRPTFCKTIANRTFCF